YLTTYYWRVSVTNNNGTSGWSTTWSFSTTGTAPYAPSLFAPVNDAIDIETPTLLVWSPSTSATSYSLQVSTNSTFSSFVYNQNELTSTSQQITGLNISTKYFWRVSATNSYGTSGWSSPWSFTTRCMGTVFYIDRSYNVVQIGRQCWLRENMDVGTRINKNLDQTNNGVIEKYCYDDNKANCPSFGGLYQWDEAMQYNTNQGTQGICPTGWHIPTLYDFETLSSTVNNDGNALKADKEGTAEGLGTNTSGFSALLAGYGYETGIGGVGFALSLGQTTFFWSSENFDTDHAYYLNLLYNYKYITRGYIYYSKNNAFSVRCIKD
ncbi:MAG: FISUMP domain-containing protein, partial [Melioribacteraceae bacterium]